ncbi:MAG TPA: class II aldolase/adducin family protein [Chroococcales cyanobacterium]
MNEPELRKVIVKVCHLLHQKGLVAATDGNVSARLFKNFLVTPSGCSKGFLEPEDLLIVDQEGKVVRSGSSKGKTTSEWRMHAAIYRERPDAMAVVHAHPPWTTACSLAGLSLEEAVLPEVYLTLGAIPTLPYATPSSSEGAEAIAFPIRNHDAVVLDRHGAIALGKDVASAYYKIEKIEHTAQVIAIGRFLGVSSQGVRTLDSDEKIRLIGVGRQLGLFH